jgi:GT2 family glycosyltransferase
VEKAENDERLGLISGKIIADPVTRRIWYAGGSISFLRGKSIARGFGEVDTGQYDTTQEVGFATGGLMLIRRAVLEKVGLLPEEYFFGQEEWDYSVAVRRAGFKLLYVPACLVYHKGDGSHWNSDPRFVYNGYRQKFIFQQKYLNPVAWRLWFVLFQLYSGFAARRALRPQHSAEADFEGIMFALRTAVADHKREGARQMHEQDLFLFQARLKAFRTEKRSVA